MSHKGSALEKGRNFGKGVKIRKFQAKIDIGIKTDVFGKNLER